VLYSLTAACPNCFTLSYIGWTFHNVPVISGSQFTGVCRIRLMDYCTRISDVSSRQRHRSANRHQLMVPRHRRITFGCRAFSVARPMEWNSPPHSFQDPARSTDAECSTFCLFDGQRDD